MVKKLLALFMGISLIMGLAACGGGSQSDTSQNSTNNAAAGDAPKIFAQHCSGCHGGNLQGGMGPNLQKIGSQLSKSQILGILKNGKPGGMPAGLISGSDADKVAAWLASKK